ncbi:MAG: TIGR01777 family oxidoreductase [Proteobacteria bacterium]|nr:TIGR01777 family oxidoreductase [Pseudomonadota bacterium]
MKTDSFIKKTRIDAPVEFVFKWHSRPGALERLSPPWDPIRVIERKGGINKGARAVLEMKAGPFPYKWTAEHTDYEENRLFRDRQVRGPFSSWVHTHSFEPDGPESSFFEDRIDYVLPFYPFGKLIGGASVKAKLARIFKYRHAVTTEDIILLLSRKNIRRPMKILMTGSSGLIGSVLIPFFTTGGHNVHTLVRKAPFLEKGEAFWDPEKKRLDPSVFDGADAVIHLAGEHIGEGRWTDEKKRRIIESRTKGTSLIAETMSKLASPPPVLICASAIGYYGNRGDKFLTEDAPPGDDFISKVCSAWEKSAQAAVDAGIRVAFMRIGIALSPAGGALLRLLLPFRAGLGGKIASGSQFMSWVGIDDVVGAFFHVLADNKIAGPVNVVSPNPVTNLEFTKTLGRVLSRPAVFSIPAAAINLAFGEMGREVLLSSTKVLPEKLLETGYRFRNPDLSGALSHLLGK